ncbi:MAG: alanine dehydrogenase [Deltaproteobacteria bacterium]|nr:alanine dehydrogenase [Deltaproteobacteria bacterium]
MIIGVPKEIKTREYRIGIVPAGVRALTARGHKVLIEKNGGLGSGISDGEFQKAGAEIVRTAGEVWDRADMVMKVKEPLPDEYGRIREGQVVYTYFHLAGVDPELTKVLVKKKAAAVAYETIQLADRSLPLLRPMSEVAGKMAIQVGAYCLEKEKGGKGILLGGVPGVKRGKVVIIGGGVVGINSAKMAVGLGAEVTILDVDLNRLAYLDDIFMGRCSTLFSDSENIAKSVRDADLVVGGVLIPGARAPKLVSEELIGEMTEGSVVVDVAVDQGGCIETCVPTTHDHPTFIKHGVVHYCVANMPGAVPRTSTFALTNTTITYARKIAEMGLQDAMRADKALLAGLNTFGGHVTYEAVADALGYDYVPALEALSKGGKAAAAKPAKNVIASKNGSPTKGKQARA